MSYKNEIKDTNLIYSILNYLFRWNIIGLSVFLYYTSIYFIDGNIFYTVYDIL